MSDDELDANNISEVKKKNMEDTIQSLDEIDGKLVVNIEDLQPDLETVPEHTTLDTPIRNSSNEVGTSSLNDYTPSMLRRMSSQHPLEYIISDPNKGMQTRSSLKNLCAFSAFVSLVEPKGC